MALFKKRKSKIVDWTERLNKQQEQVEQMRADMAENSSQNYSQDTSASPFPFFAGNTSNTPNYGNTSVSSEEQSLEERRKRLGKRLLDMTNKIEDLSNQIYKMQQRIEVLERRMGSGY